MNYYDVIIKKLRGLRAECNLSLDEVSKKLGVNRSTISLYEKGKRKLPLKTFLDLLELYNIDIITFLENCVTRKEQI